MPFKVSYRFTQQSTLLGGWTENFWYDGDDQSAVRSAAQALAPALFNIHGAQNGMPGWRISKVGGGVPALNVAYAGAGPVTVAVGDERDADYPTCALLIRMHGGTGYYTHQWVRGIRDNLLQQGGRYDEAWAGTFPASFAVFAARLVANRFSIRVLDRTVPQIPISNFNYSLGTFDATSNPLVGMTPNSPYVRIKGMGTGNPANGVWALTWVDAVGTTPAYARINNWTPTTYSPAKPPKAPKVVLQRYVYPLVAAPAFPVGTLGAEIIRGTSHKVGRPLGLLTGKSKKRRT